MLKLWKFKQSEKAVVQPTSLTQPIPEGATLEQLTSELRQLFAQENSNHHRMGQIYNYIVANRLAEKAGFKDTREYLSKHLADLSQATLSMYGTVAENFSELVAQRFGVTCLHLLINYKEAADLEVNAEEPGPTVIEVPDEKGYVTPKPFAQCSVDEMRRALQRKRKPASTKPLPPEKVVLGEQYAEAVARRFPKGKGTLVKFALRNQKGKAVVDLKGVPLEQMLLLAEAITAPLPPVNELPAPPLPLSPS